MIFDRRTCLASKSMLHSFCRKLAAACFRPRCIFPGVNTRIAGQLLKIVFTQTTHWAIKCVLQRRFLLQQRRNWERSVCAHRISSKYNPTAHLHHWTHGDLWLDELDCLKHTKQGFCLAFYWRGKISQKTSIHLKIPCSRSSSVNTWFPILYAIWDQKFPHFLIMLSPFSISFCWSTFANACIVSAL